MPNVIVPLADGFEDLEAVAIVDLLRRAGIGVKTVGMGGSIVTSAMGMRVYADMRWDDVEMGKVDCIVLPGGSKGVENLARDQRLLQVLDVFVKTGKLTGAICAAPAILAKRGLLKDRKATICPGNEKLLDKPRNDKVVVDGNIVTSQGPGTAVEFSLKLVELLAGRDKAQKLKQQIVA
jgi:4-methyl-5(b-hydroxyethyl)-thiazole monophosphate biosynthesis